MLHKVLHLQVHVNGFKKEENRGINYISKVHDHGSFPNMQMGLLAESGRNFGTDQGQGMAWRNQWYTRTSEG